MKASIRRKGFSNCLKLLATGNEFSKEGMNSVFRDLKSNEQDISMEPRRNKRN
jgi:hypothetical protein